MLRCAQPFILLGFCGSNLRCRGPTLNIGVANQYLKEARLNYSDERSYMIRVALPDHATARHLALGECIRLYSEHEARTFFESFIEHRFVRELVVRQRRAG